MKIVFNKPLFLLGVLTSVLVYIIIHDILRFDWESTFVTTALPFVNLTSFSFTRVKKTST